MSVKMTMAVMLVLLTVTSVLAATNMRTGKVLETMDSGGYTYILLNSDGGKVWVAGPETSVSVGTMVSVSQGMMMTDFTSKTLNRTFPKIYFVSKVLAPEVTPDAAARGAMGHNKVPITAQAKVAKAKGGYSVAEVVAQGGVLAGKQVAVRGHVVKFTPDVMHTNWIHLQDGTGGDLTVTSGAVVAVGDLILVTGTLEANKDFGAGYKYDVIIERAEVAVE